MKPQYLISALLLVALSAAAAQPAQTSSKPSASNKAAQVTTTETRPAKHASAAERAHASQPHWITPLQTLTPLLEQEYRFDVGHTMSPSFRQWVFGGKGLELIPTDHTEVILGQPAYARATVNNFRESGWGPGFVTAKYRLLAAPEQNGNYVVSLMFTAQYPDGGKFSPHNWSFFPQLGYGKGWGRFDVQGTVGYSIPSSGTVLWGHELSFHEALQYRVPGKLHFWPEMEFDTEHFIGGLTPGATTDLVTPGLVAGPFPLYGPVKLTLGGGVAFQVYPTGLNVKSPVFSVRLPF